MGKISIDDTPAELGAVAGDTVEVVLVGARIEFRDERAVLIDGSLDNENIDASRECGSNHFPPFCFVAGAAGGTVAIAC